MGFRLTRAAHILRILSTCLVNEIGKMSFKILKTFSLLIARSTWIRTLATLRVLVTSSFDSCLPCEKAGMFNLTRSGNSKSWMVKPLSAMTSSPGTNLFRMPQSCTINLSLARPPYALEMCMMSPLGQSKHSTLLCYAICSYYTTLPSTSGCSPSA